MKWNGYHFIPFLCHSAESLGESDNHEFVSRQI